MKSSYFSSKIREMRPIFLAVEQYKQKFEMKKNENENEMAVIVYVFCLCYSFGCPRLGLLILSGR